MFKFHSTSKTKDNILKRSLVNHRAIAFIGLITCTASAQGITITNPGFETQSLADGARTTSLTGWTATGPVTHGAYNPVTSDYPGEAPEGLNVAYVSTESRVNGISQILATTFQIGADYTLTVDVGNNADYDGFDGYQVQLLAGDTIIAQDDNSLGILEGTFRTVGVVYTYDAADSGLAGEALQIRLMNKVSTFGLSGSEVNFDNVTLVPEPSSLALLGLGGLLIARRRRG